MIGRRSDSLFYDNLSRRELCDKIAYLEADLKEEKEKSAKLRNEVDNLMDFEHLTSVAVAYAGCDKCGEYKQTMLRLFAENVKLRELLQRLLAEYRYMRVRPRKVYMQHEGRMRVIEEEMRELGLVVE